MPEPIFMKLGVYIIFGFILEIEWDGVVWTGFIWLSTGTSGGFL
jgi:hypothetical protein